MSRSGNGERHLEVTLDELSKRATAPEGAVRPHDEGRRWRCLITNDDGIHSEGLRVLAQVALEAGFEVVVVVAPMRESSGASASITAIEEDGHFVVEPRPLDGLEDACTVLAVGGLPAFIALTGMRGAFGPAPDVVLSGINNGPNTGYAVLHSGTVGAALTASTFGARAMAVSLNVRTRTVSGAGLPLGARFALLGHGGPLRPPGPADAARLEAGHGLQHQRPQHRPREGAGVRTGPAGPVRGGADQRGRTGRGLREGDAGRDRRRVRAGDRRRVRGGRLRLDHGVAGGVRGGNDGAGT